MDDIKIVECPRDAMQSWPHMIATEQKISYMDQLLKVGFDTIDFTSFVSHKLIPQMADAHEVAAAVVPDHASSKLLAIVLNIRGAEEALQHAHITYLGFPFSVSPTFQQRNANSTIADSLEDISEIQRLCKEKGKELVVYLSMAFGNPYGDPYNELLVMKAAESVSKIGVNIISLADTVGLATPKQIESLVRQTIQSFPANEIGVHLHSTLDNWKDKLNAAHSNGCFRFDGAINGYGGCPMAEDVLVGNMNTGMMVSYFRGKGFLQNISADELQKAEEMAATIFL